MYSSAILFLWLASVVVAQMATPWSAAAAPADATGAAQWTLSLRAPYCGGYDIGDGVFVEPEPPLKLPDSIPPDGVLFDGAAAEVSVNSGILRVAPAPGLARSMICMDGERPFAIELLPSLGLPSADSGPYKVDVWIGSASAPVPLELKTPAI